MKEQNMNVLIWKPPNRRPCGGTCAALSKMRAYLGLIELHDRRGGLSQEALDACRLKLEGASWEFLGCQRESRVGRTCATCT